MLVVDRFENGFAICENGPETLRIPLSGISAGVKEGDVLTEENGVYTVNAGATEHRRLLAAQRLKRLLSAAENED